MEYKLKSGNTLNVEQDEFGGDNPRSWDNLAKMIFFGKYKHLGDNHNVTLDAEFESRSDFMERGAELIKKKLNAAIVKPVHFYSHSGEGISTSYNYPFNCPWDSGTIGFAVVTKEDIRKEYSVKRINANVLEKANNVLENEVELLNQYISGEVYCFEIVTPDGNTLDSCGGFYGSDITKNGILEHINDVLVE